MAKIEVRSEITGTVWKVKCAPGARVEEGEILMLIESMKMEIPVMVDEGGVVEQVLVQEKDPVIEGQVVVLLEG